MAETRSKSSKKHGGSGSFISNLSSAIKKSSKRQLEDKQVPLPNKKWKCLKVPTKLINDNSQDERNNSEIITESTSEITNQVLADFSEEPLCFDGSDKEVVTYLDQKLSKNDAPTKDSNACGTNLSQAEDVINLESMSHEVHSSTISQCNHSNNEPKVSLPESNEVTSGEVIGNEVMISTSNLLHGPSGCSGSNADSDTMDSDVKDPPPKAFLKPYNDLVNILEEIKCINVVVKKIKEEMEKLTK